MVRLKGGVRAARPNWRVRPVWRCNQADDSFSQGVLNGICQRAVYLYQSFGWVGCALYQ